MCYTCVVDELKQPKQQVTKMRATMLFLINNEDVLAEFYLDFEVDSDRFGYDLSNVIDVSLDKERTLKHCVDSFGVSEALKNIEIASQLDLESFVRNYKFTEDQQDILNELWQEDLLERGIEPEGVDNPRDWI